MIDTERLKARLRELENAKDEIIETSVRITRLSKSIIYSLIRNDAESARKYISEMQELMIKLKKLIVKYPMYYNNAVVSLQEYVEAMAMWYFTTEGRLPEINELDVDVIPYVNGIADFVGELSRKATEEMIRGNLEFAKRAKDVMENIYLDMLNLEPRDFEMRKKVDYIASNINWLNEKIFYKTLALPQIPTNIRNANNTENNN
ncbi:MAG: haloacid dehalogenase [Vulcanisaeta sp. AZ3]|jgi:translin|nr:MAG: haloacid dehalogenase [Vulcanisaeta sp. AZ3]